MCNSYRWILSCLFSPGSRTCRQRIVPVSFFSPCVVQSRGLFSCNMYYQLASIISLSSQISNYRVKVAITIARKGLESMIRKQANKYIFYTHSQGYIHTPKINMRSPQFRLISVESRSRNIFLCSMIRSYSLSSAHFMTKTICPKVTYGQPGWI